MRPISIFKTNYFNINSRLLQYFYCFTIGDELKSPVKTHGISNFEFISSIKSKTHFMPEIFYKISKSKTRGEWSELVLDLSEFITEKFFAFIKSLPKTNI